MSGLVDHALVRVACRPLEEVRAARAAASVLLVEELEGIEERLAADRDALSDDLHRCVGGLADRDLRRGLLALRRAVHNDRLPAPAARPSALGARLPAAAGLRRRLEQWEQRVRRRDDLQERAEVLVREELLERIDRLSRVWLSDAFRTGVLVASPTLYHDLCKLRRGDRLSGKRRRRLEDSALAYHVRMATKTSPFGTFTAVAASHLDSTQAGWSDGGTLRLETPAEVNAVLSQRLHEALRLAPRRIDGHRVSLNPSLLREGHLLYVHRNRDPAGARLAQVEESFRTVDPTPVLQTCLDLLDKPDEWPVFATVVDRLADEYPGIAVDALRAFVRQLVEAGILDVDTGVRCHTATVWDDFATEAARRGGEAGGALAGHSRAVARELERIRGCGAAGKAAAVERIASALDEASALTGAPPLPADRRGVVFVGSVVPDRLVLDRDRLAGVARDLRALTRLLLAFDAGFLWRRLATSFHDGTGDRHARVPLTRFLHGFYEQCYEPLFGEEAAPAWDPFGLVLPPGMLPEVDALAGLRARFVDECATLLGDGGADRVDLPAALVEEVAAEAARHWREALPVSAGFLGHLQPASRGEGYAFVLNQVLPGYGTYAARYCDERTYGSTGRLLTDLVRRRLAWSREGVELAEVVATFGFNGQIHAPLTRRQVAYPGETCVPGDERLLEWRSLAVTHCEQVRGLALEDTRDGRFYLPVVLGSLGPHLRPVLCRALSALGPSFVPDFMLLDLLEHRLGAPLGGVRRYPPLWFGDTLLQRATWRVPASHAPVIEERASDFAAFRRLRAWAREHGVPARTFVTPVRITDLFRAGETAGRVPRLYKPFLLDLDDPLSCRLFRRYCADAGQTLTFSEMVPQPRDLVFERGGRGHVSEVLLECW